MEKERGVMLGIDVDGREVGAWNNVFGGKGFLVEK